MFPCFKIILTALSLVLLKCFAFQSNANLVQNPNFHQRNYLVGAEKHQKNVGKYTVHSPGSRIPIPVNLISGLHDATQRRVEANAHYARQHNVHMETHHSSQSHVPQSNTKHKQHSMTEHKQEHNVEKDSSLDDLLEVMGPHLFLIPFVAKVFPLAIPAVPLTYILTRYAPATLSEIQERVSQIIEQIREFLMHPGEMQEG